MSDQTSTILSATKFNSQEATMTTETRTYDKVEACKVLGIKHFAHLRRLVLDGHIKTEGMGPSKNAHVQKVLLNADSVDNYAKTMQHRGNGDGAHAFEIRVDPKHIAPVLKFLKSEVDEVGDVMIGEFAEALPVFIEALQNAIDLTERRREYNAKHNVNDLEA